jgi:hypothetical protein
VPSSPTAGVLRTVTESAAISAAANAGEIDAARPPEEEANVGRRVGPVNPPGGR